MLPGGSYLAGRERRGPTPPVYGQDAATLDGAAWLQIFNCAFGPNNAVVHFLGGKSQLEVRYVSALMTDGAGFLVDQGAKADIPMYQSLISCPNNRLNSGAAALISQKGGPPKDVDCTGGWNWYHDLDDFWIIDGISQRAKNWPMDDQILAMSPWLDQDPLSKLREGNPKKAFRPDLNLPELRFNDRLVGVHKCTWGPVFDNSAPVVEEKKTELANTLIVDPTVAKAGGGVRSGRRRMRAQQLRGDLGQGRQQPRPGFRHAHVGRYGQCHENGATSDPSHSGNPRRKMFHSRQGRDDGGAVQPAVSASGRQ